LIDLDLIQMPPINAQAAAFLADFKGLDVSVNHRRGAARRRAAAAGRRYRRSDVGDGAAAGPRSFTAQ
jgi:hypothetical protein